MSYSFTVRAADKDDAVRKVRDELDKLVDQQPIHAADRDHAETAAVAFINGVLPDDPDKDVQVTMNGSIGYYGTTDDPSALTSVGVSLSVMMVKREAA